MRSRKDVPTRRRRRGARQSQRRGENDEVEEEYFDSADEEYEYVEPESVSTSRRAQGHPNEVDHPDDFADDETWEIRDERLAAEKDDDTSTSSATASGDDVPLNPYVRIFRKYGV